MKQLSSLLLLMLVGCSGSSAPAVPPTTGDFVKNNEGVGTAQIFGIDFRVDVNSSGTSSDDAIDANFVDTKSSSARKHFSIGDDIKIELDSIDESEVRFIFNGQDFGTLNVGDKVVIDDARNVEVNGTSRLTNGSK